jgi:hypothetical protein
VSRASNLIVSEDLKVVEEAFRNVGFEEYVLIFPFGSAEPGGGQSRA